MRRGTSIIICLLCLSALLNGCALLYFGYKNKYFGSYRFRCTYNELRTDMAKVIPQFAPSGKNDIYRNVKSVFEEFYIVLPVDERHQETLFLIRYYGNDEFKAGAGYSQVFVAGIKYPGPNWNDNPGRKTKRIAQKALEEQFLSKLEHKFYIPED